VKVNVGETVYHPKVIVDHLVGRAVVAALIPHQELPALQHDRPDEAGVAQIVHCKRNVAIRRVVELARAIRDGAVMDQIRFPADFDRLPSHG